MIDVCLPICGDGFIMGDEVCDKGISTNCENCLVDQAFNNLVSKSDSVVIGLTSAATAISVISTASKLATLSPAMFI